MNGRHEIKQIQALRELIDSNCGGVHWFRLAHYKNARAFQIRHLAELREAGKIGIRKTPQKTLLAVRIIAQE